jgi:hypothetical protein
MLSVLFGVYNTICILNDVIKVLEEVRRQTPRYTPEEREEIKRRYKEKFGR